MINKIKYGEINYSIKDKEKYLELKDYEEADRWGMKIYEDWTAKYKNIMRKATETIACPLCSSALECYLGNSYREINDFLRFGTDAEDNRCRELADVLSIILCSAPVIPQNIILYRVVSDEFISMLIEKNKEANPVQEKGFMSTTLLQSIAIEKTNPSKTNILKIYVPESTVGVYADSVAKRQEAEMLLLPDKLLGLISYPYKDSITGGMIYECTLFK